MPQFTKSGRYYRISYITGPSHVLLGLLIEEENNSSDINMISLGIAGKYNHGVHDLENMKKGVNEGISKANNTFGTNYSVKEIQYIENDTPNYTLYAHCAYLIVKSIKEGVEFKVINE